MYIQVQVLGASSARAPSGAGPLPHQAAPPPLVTGASSARGCIATLFMNSEIFMNNEYEYCFSRLLIPLVVRLANYSY